ncbi:ribosomal protein S18-alanine N-acetyltransferase [Oenococcus alcoholitolerans]|uniref:ribosomal protein S18-alanine N-acetyltransferase n=1 Tax=Oenococcus alcoholitolerans TaxID=931074 RepID=UPI003F6EE86A
MFRKSKKISYFPDRKLKIGDSTFLLRKAKLSDTSTLVKIEEAVYVGQQPWSQFAFISEIENTRDNLYLILMTDNRAIAFIGLSHRHWKRDFHITNIAVLPIWQNHGIGDRLLKIAFEVGRKIGLTKITLEVRRSNYPAQHLYKKNGFKNTALLKGYYDIDQEDAYEMERFL